MTFIFKTDIFTSEHCTHNSVYVVPYSLAMEVTKQKRLAKFDFFWKESLMGIYAVLQYL